MRGRTLGTVILVVAASLGVLSVFSRAQTSNPKQPATKAPQPATKAPNTTQQNVPAEYQAGIAKLRIAKGYLEKAGDKWGGYRVKAIASIDQAFTALGVSPESTPNEMQSGNVDEPAMMNSGISNLQAAKADFAKAGNNWGGRKEKGVALIDQALKDLQTGIDWAKKNKTY
jgi:hypothetical protein